MGMQYVNNDIHTVGVGNAFGYACMLLTAGRGKRSMLPRATVMLYQTRLFSTRKRQATEIVKEWKEVSKHRDNLLQIINRITGISEEKLWFDMQRPLYMQAKDAINYGLIDRIINN